MFDKNEKLSRMTLKHAILLITYTIALIWVILHMHEVLHVVSMVIGMLKPFIYGIMMAFIFNLPLKFFMKKLPDSLKKWKKPLAVLCSTVLVFGLLIFITLIVVPVLVESVANLVMMLPGYFEDTMNMIDKLLRSGTIPKEMLDSIGVYVAQIQDTLIKILRNGVPQLISMAGGFASGLANIGMALVIAVYLTISKDKLISQLKRFLYAFTSTKVNTFLLKVGKLTNVTFSNFVAGQLVEAVIIGVLCYIGCLIFRFPYAPILSVVIGCTNVIPYFGPFLGTGFGAFLVALVNPLQAVFFIIFGSVLQQIESNLIYPRVVGTTVGLSGLWVLFAITIGGGLFGIAGMILGLPVFSVIYTLIREIMNKRLKEKQEEERSKKKVCSS